MARNTSGSLLVVDDDRYIQSAMADYLRSLGTSHRNRINVHRSD
jgi:CheY-like chemotaxis protein